MYIIKIGGGESINLEGIVTDLTTLDKPCVVVHGANVLRDQVAEKLGIPKQVITSSSGYTSVFSDQDALDIIMMAYSGLRNKKLVALCQRNGINAIGLTGLDGRIVQGKRNAGIRVRENGKNLIKRDLSGKPKTANGELLSLLLDSGYTPVLTIPIVDESGFAINTENDDVVNVLHQELNAEIVLQLIEAPGLMDDVADPDSLIAELTQHQLAAREQAAEGRIKRKLHALSKLAQQHNSTIIISDGRSEHPIKNALNGSGTRIIKHEQE